MLNQVPEQFRNLHTKLNELRSLFLKTGTNELRVFGAVADGYNKPENEYTGSSKILKELVKNKTTGKLFDKYGTENGQIIKNLFTKITNTIKKKK